MSVNLFGNRGGRQSKHTHVPSEVEGFALAIALTMYFVKQTDSSHPQFYSVIAEEVKRMRATTQIWSKDEIKKLIQEKLWKKIPGDQLAVYMQKAQQDKHGAPLKGEARKRGAQEIIGAAMCLYITHMSTAGATYASASELAAEAHIDELLKLKVLGGHADWELDDFLSEWRTADRTRDRCSACSDGLAWFGRDTWDELGGIGGLKTVAIQQLTKMCALIHGRNIICSTCELPCLEYKGNRGKLEDCKCDCNRADNDEGRRVRPRTAATTGGEGGMRRGMGEIDRTGQGMLELYTRKLEQVKAQDWFTPALTPKQARARTSLASVAHALCLQAILVHLICLPDDACLTAPWTLRPRESPLMHMHPQPCF
jgi:hypothetical protein